MPKTPRSESHDGLRLQLCFAVAALEFGAHDLALGRPGARGPLTNFARQVAMRLAHATLGMNCTQIARLVGRDRSTVAHGCQVVEEECDDPVFAMRMDRMERAVRSLAQIDAGAA